MFARSLRGRLLLLVAVPVLGTVVLGAFSLHALNKTQNHLKEVFVRDFPELQSLQEMLIRQSEARNDIARMTLAANAAESAAAGKALAHDFRLFDEAASEFDRLSHSADVLKSWGEVKKRWEKARASARRVVDLLGADHGDEARDILRGSLQEDFAALQKGFKDISDTLSGESMESGVAVGADSRRVVAITLVAAAIVAAVSGILGHLISQKLNASFHDILERLGKASKLISEASGEMLSNSDRLLGGVTKQASAIQETAASLAEMSTMVAKTAEHATDCSGLSARVTEKSHLGSDTMRKMVDSMGAIESANAQMEKMVDIIKDISVKTAVINDIVFKTQLLSLNASIEAARAGSHGRGFAVVAEEVGSLAQLSGSAALEISSLLKRSMTEVTTAVKATQDRVKDGRQVTIRAMSVFEEITSDLQTISTQNEHISNAAREQETGIKQSSSAMTLVDEAANDNSSVATVARKSSQLLKEQSDQIRRITGSIEELILGRSQEGGAEARAPGRAVSVTKKPNLNWEEAVNG